MSQQKVLVTGGAGYIGSHVVKQLGEQGYQAVIYDNLSTGSSKAVLHGELAVGDLSDLKQLGEVFSQHQFDAVLHFAASISVPESVTNPLKYYGNNTANTLNVLRCCRDFQVNKLIFSSTAAVYGEVKEPLVDEQHPTSPVNPYGKSKLMSEMMIRDYAEASELKYVVLRYFNVAGADASGRIGQTGKKAAHLIKVACDAALGLRDSVSIFGTDYDTPDGTGVRDYIHVEDLASAHIDALTYLSRTDSESQILNCGYSQGYSVREVLSTVKEISEVDFKVKETHRRAGDPACVVADSHRIKKILGWQPKYNNLSTIVRSAFEWEKQKFNSI